MTSVTLQISLDDLIGLFEQLPPDQKRIMRQRIDQNWATRFDDALNAIHADIPSQITEDEAIADIEQAIGDVRSMS